MLGQSKADLSSPAGSQTSISSKQTGPCDVNAQGNNIVITIKDCIVENLSPLNRKAYLKKQTLALAEEIVNFINARDIAANGWRREAIVQSLDDAIKNRPNGRQAFFQRKHDYDQKTKQEFMTYYWPEVLALKADLVKWYTIDLEPLDWAISKDDPRAIGYMLSVTAERIGQKPPFHRTLTTLELKDAFRPFLELPSSTNSSPLQIEVRADLSDENSRAVAEKLRSTLASQNWPVNPKVQPVKDEVPKPQGILITFPSNDWWSVGHPIADPILSSLSLCRIEWKPVLVNKPQPSSVFIFEVWPEGNGPIPPTHLLQP